MDEKIVRGFVKRIELGLLLLIWLFFLLQKKCGVNAEKKISVGGFIFCVTVDVEATEQQQQQQRQLIKFHWKEFVGQQCQLTDTGQHLC